MFRRKYFLFVTVFLLSIFFMTTNYLLATLPTEREVHSASVEDKIYRELATLPAHYNNRPRNSNENYNEYQNFKTTTIYFKDKQVKKLWQIANLWLNNGNKTQLVDIKSPHIGDIIYLLQHAKITQADVTNAKGVDNAKGTQLKLYLTLQGHQVVIFKPKWYDQKKIFEGPIYSGKDRYNSEIFAFYLSIILNRPLCPISVERRISLRHDVLPVATQKLAETMTIRNNTTCVSGKCLYCSKHDPVCEDENSSLLGAVIFLFNTKLISHRSPWQRTYIDGKNAVWQDFPEDYCATAKRKVSRRRLYDLIDVSIFDFLIQNGDRHHYETVEDTLLWIDNGKGLGNPHKHYLDILAPLYQCCTIRKSMYNELMKLTGGVMREKLEKMPNIKNVIRPEHLKAVEDRLLLIFATFEYCRKYKKLIFDFTK